MGRKFLVATLVLMSLVVLLAACAPAATPSPTPGGALGTPVPTSAFATSTPSVLATPTLAGEETPTT